MTSLKATYSIQEVVEEALLEIPEIQRTEANHKRFLNLALSGLRRLRIAVTKDGKKTVKITPNALNRYDFPDDMETFVTLWVPVNGEIWRLTENKNIIPTKTVTGIDESLDEDYGEGVDLPTVQHNSFLAEGGINREGYFTLDYENREIVINNNRQSELVMEYTTLGSTSIIPTLYVEALKAWICWKDSVKDRTAPMNSKLYYEKIYKDEVKVIKKFEGPSLTTLVDAWRRKSLVQ